jgi:hypothetical protein
VKQFVSRRPVGRARLDLVEFEWDVEIGANARELARLLE